MNPITLIWYTFVLLLLKLYEFNNLIYLHDKICDRLVKQVILLTIINKFKIYNN